MGGTSRPGSVHTLFVPSRSLSGHLRDVFGTVAVEGGGPGKVTILYVDEVLSEHGKRFTGL